MSQAIDVDSAVFHRKKGLLSEYMDRNGWMTKVHRLMGKERSDVARAYSNHDRYERVQSLRKSPNSIEFQTTAVLQRPTDKTYFETIPRLMCEKMRIRRNRNLFTNELLSKR